MKATLNLAIDNNKIEESFDSIAKQLFNEFELHANDTVFEFTEIEFYYFHEKNHPDNYTHEHQRDEGEWRFHNQGIDITFESKDDSDGGILIRGIKTKDNYVNGPRKILMKIFESLGKVEDENKIILKKKTKKSDNKISKTFRHLPNKIQDEKFHNKPYRYYINIEKLEIANNIKDQIKKNSREI